MLGQTLFLASFMLPLIRNRYPENETLNDMYGFIYYILVQNSFISGFFQSCFWVASGKYLSECASATNIGKFNSFFLIGFNIGRTLGFFMGAFLINSMDASTFYIILTSVALFATLYIIFLPAPLPKEESPMKKPAARLTVCENFKATIKLSYAKRMLLAYPIMIWNAITCIIHVALFIPLMARTMTEELTKSE